LQRCSPVRPGKYVSLKDTIASFSGILNGEYDHLPEQAFYMVGGIEEAIEKAPPSSPKPWRSCAPSRACARKWDAAEAADASAEPGRLDLGGRTLVDGLQVGL
jgi:hypothetical protein